MLFSCWFVLVSLIFRASQGPSRETVFLSYTKFPELYSNSEHSAKWDPQALSLCEIFPSGHSSQHISVKKDKDSVHFQLFHFQ